MQNDLMQKKPPPGHIVPVPSRENTRSVPKIRLAPQEELVPRSTRIPFRRARRWRSQGEENLYGVPAVSVFVTQAAYWRFNAHAQSDLQNEVGGWLIGKWRLDKQSGEQFVVIETILPALYTQQGSAYLTFTQESQVALHNHIQTYYPDKELVGWFHTHPRMGVFLSEYDNFLHRNFFPELWQVALVIEPYGGTGGFFIRQPDGTLDTRRYYGFYELLNWRRHSVVQWRNLLSEE